MAAAAIRIALSFPSVASQREKKAQAKAKLSLVPAKRSSFSHSWDSKKVKPSVCYSSNFDRKTEEDGSNAPDDAFSSPDDVDNLWKLAAGSVGGAAAIKYGSIVFPDLTRPNILQALLMISLPVMVAVLILIKESRTDSQSKENF